MTHRIVLPFAISGAPLAPPDPRCIPGTLLLADPTHPASTPLPATITNSTTIPNIAAAQATALGVSDNGDAKCVQQTDQTKARLIKTSAGSIVLDNSITNDTLGAYVGVQWSAGLKTYLQANTGHTFHLSVAWRIIRELMPTTLGTTYPYATISGTDYMAATLAITRYGSTVPGVTAAVPSSSAPARLGFGSRADGPELLAAVTSSSLTLSGMNDYLSRTGPQSSGSVHTYPSYVLRSVWLVDLTANAAAGGTANHTSCMALATQAQTVALATGGRWNGDVIPAALA